MRLPPFSVLEPNTKKGALSVLDKYRERAKILAGGTELVALLKLGLLAPSYLVSLKSIGGLKGIKTTKREIIVGSSTTIREIAHSPLINHKFKGVGQAARLLAAPPIQNRATIGGNILQNTRCMYRNQSDFFRSGIKACYKSGGNVCHAAKSGRRCFSVYQGDMAPPLISFNSKVKLEKKGSCRIIALTDLFSGHGEKPFLMEEDELLTEIIIPLADSEYGSSYEKLRIRKGLEYPLVSVAAFLSRNEDNKTGNLRVVVGAVGPAPKMLSVELDYWGNDGPPVVDMDKVSETTAAMTEMVDNLSLPPAYRRKIVKVLTRRAFQKAFLDMGRGA
jgi:4-hydroxybenzoyl-CoA reductase subunit beta